MVAGVSFNSMVKPLHSTVQAAGKIGSYVGKKGAEFLAPKLLKEASVRAGIAAVGNSTLGGAVGAAMVPILSPVITPIAAYGAGLLASHAITFLGNKIYEAVSDPAEPIKPLEVANQKGLIESVGPGMVANGLVKGLELIVEGTPAGAAMGLIRPFAVPLVAEAVNGVAQHIFMDRKG